MDVGPAPLARLPLPIAEESAGGRPASPILAGQEGLNSGGNDAVSTAVVGALDRDSLNQSPTRPGAKMFLPGTAGAIKSEEQFLHGTQLPSASFWTVSNSLMQLSALYRPIRAVLACDVISDVAAYVPFQCTCRSDADWCLPSDAVPDIPVFRSDPRGAGAWYGNFEYFLGHFSRVLRSTPPRTRRVMFSSWSHDYRMLTSACNPML